MNAATKVREDLVLQLYGDYNYWNIGGICCIYFNKDIVTDVLNEVGADGLYQIALDGNWTFDKLAAYARTITADLDGDQLMCEDDRYGLINVHLPTFTQAMGTVYSSRDEDGVPFIDNASEHNVDVAQKLASFYSDRSVCLPWGADVDYFLNDKAGFYSARLSSSYDDLRNMESEYGILPLPKYDETQANYRSTCWSSSGWAVPSSIQESQVELAATFMEAMASASYRIVIPAYYEKALKTKYTHDSVSSQIIDLIHDTSYRDFADIYCDKIDNVVDKSCAVIALEVSAFTSQTASFTEASQKTLDKYLKRMDKIQ